ncbi:hypothetical protein NQZ71_13080 [Niallia taxi]|uniref:hypothetical protein n=1 Tax=Niallia taxi TaxID=2499688 RepID=UPI002934A271|nr:hypothetical protein [Niallia taxi]WOD61748.1 hypothetical protein NQZ71_13080 [Niallia taxi]
MKQEIITTIKNFLPIAGVLLGFLLATTKDWITDKPKVKLNLKGGKINYFKMIEDVKIYVHEDEAEFLLIDLKVDIYNYGKGNTAIKDVVIDIKRGERVLALQPEMHINNNNNEDYSFTLDSSSIVTMNLKLVVDRQEENREYIFEDSPIKWDGKDRLLFNVLATDIKNKEHKLKVEPAYVLGAIEGKTEIAVEN